jgi:putative ABC transport system permease protein
MTHYRILFLNYLQTTIRKMIKQPTYALINMVGLTSGIMVFLLIFAYVVKEYSYDRDWKNHELIYRISGSLNFNGRLDHFALSSYNMAQAMKTDFPEVDAATMIFRTSFNEDQIGITVWHDERMLELPSFTYADEDFFKVFDYPFVEGSPETALTEPKSMVINTEIAQSFFGNEPALGKMIRINKTTFVITGVIDKSTRTSHLEFDALASLSTFSQKRIEEFRSDWFWLLGSTYVKFNNKQAAENFGEKLNFLVEETIKPWIASVNVDGSIELRHEAVSEIHFNNKLQYDSSSNTNKQVVMIFAFIALFLLVIAAINYMNLSTARSMKRAREIGIRKVAGAHRGQLIVQFLGESYLLTTLAFILAWALAEISMPWFNNLTGLQLSLSGITENSVSLSILGTTFILLGLLSGFFPAIVLSSFSPVAVLRPGIMMAGGNQVKLVNLRKSLVVLQFVISIGMIISTLIVSSQLKFMQMHPKGFDSEQVMIIHYPGDSSLVANKEVIRQQLLVLPEVKAVSTTQSLPGYRSGRLMFFVGDTVKSEVHTMNLFVVDHTFFETLSIPLVEGRLFSKEYPNDAKTAFVVNKAAVDFLGNPNPLDVKMFCGMDVDGKIVGVVENFNYASLHNPIEPLVFILNNPDSPRLSYLAVKIQTNNLSQTIKKISELWQNFDRKHFFHYTFLDDRFAKQYKHEQRMLSLFGYFSFIVILISCLGLFGLSVFSIEQRTREIGIRKVLGSSRLGILKLLTGSFMILVIIAGIIAMPLVYYLMSEWLSNFPYRVEMNALWYIGGFFGATIVAMATVLVQAVKALNSNPVDAIKYE